MARQRRCCILRRARGGDAPDLRAPRGAADRRRGTVGLHPGRPRGGGTMSAPRDAPDRAPCPHDACPHLAWYHHERIRSIGQAPCSTCAVCAAAVEPPSPVLLCDDCFADLTGQEPECEDGCSLDLDHMGVCAPRAADTDACTECGSVDRLHVVDAAQLLQDGDEEYDHSRAKEDAPNASLGED